MACVLGIGPWESRETAPLDVRFEPDGPNAHMLTGGQPPSFLADD